MRTEHVFTDNEAALKFTEHFGSKPEHVICAPGRTEIMGNHTDHQHGRVIAAPVDLKMYGFIKETDDGCARIFSEGYGEFETDLRDTAVREEEYGTSRALVRGMAASFENRAGKGFSAYIRSDIPPGSGLSSSAAFEILIGRILSKVTGEEKTPLEMAKAGQRAENMYFLKPCGLMDQTACASEGIIAIDFKDPEEPEIRKLELDISKAGYDLCIIKCGAGHEELTGEYKAITDELSGISGYFGKTALKDVPEQAFFDELSSLRKSFGDRAVLRAMHVYEENARVEEAVSAAEKGDMDGFLELVRRSGRSSERLMQNIIPAGSVRHQEMAAAIALSEKALNGRGAVRVHGGGFAGTVQAYVPHEMKEYFGSFMERYLGAGCCMFLNII